MSTQYTFDENAPILVEITPRPGLIETAAPSAEQLQVESLKAINSAMSTILNTARMVNSAMDSLKVKPSQTEIEFGIKLIAETGAIIAKAGGEATFNVKLTWGK